MYQLTVFFLLVCKLSTAQEDSCSFFGNKPIYPYYAPTLSASGNDFHTTKNAFRKAITAKTDFDGIITVVFFVNYSGEANFYRMQACDNNYQPVTISSDHDLLAEQVLAAVKQSGPWKPAYDKKTGVVNSRKFYSFRFKQGTLIDILPK